MMTATGSTATFVYVASAGNQEIAVYRLEPAGHLAALAAVAIPGRAPPQTSIPLAVSPDKRLLFAALRGEPSWVATFAIDPQDGSLAPIGGGPLPAPMAYLTVDRTGRYLLAA